MIKRINELMENLRKNGSPNVEMYDAKVKELNDIANGLFTEIKYEVAIYNFIEVLKNISNDIGTRDINEIKEELDIIVSLYGEPKEEDKVENISDYYDDNNGRKAEVVSLTKVNKNSLYGNIGLDLPFKGVFLNDYLKNTGFAIIPPKSEFKLKEGLLTKNENVSDDMLSNFYKNIMNNNSTEIDENIGDDIISKKDLIKTSNSLSGCKSNITDEDTCYSYLVLSNIYNQKLKIHRKPKSNIIEFEISPLDAQEHYKTININKFQLKIIIRALKYIINGEGVDTTTLCKVYDDDDKYIKISSSKNCLTIPVITLGTSKDNSLSFEIQDKEDSEFLIRFLENVYDKISI